MRKRENKKSKLESNKLIFFQLGLIAALLFVLYAFEYKSYEGYELPELSYDGNEIPTDFVPPTVHKKPLPPPPAIIVIFRPDITEEPEYTELIIDVGAGEDTPTDWEPKDDPEPRIIEDEPVLVISGEMPSFPGGFPAMRKFLADNIVYPRLAKEVGITGIVYLEFIIEKDGSITNIVLLKMINGGCDEEAVRVIGIMPKWNPGKQNGIPVRVKLTIPVKFSLL